jgi:hypothetical protein
VEYSSAELTGWVAYLELEEQRDYDRQLHALATIASLVFGKKEE